MRINLRRKKTMTTLIARNPYDRSYTHGLERDIADMEERLILMKASLANRSESGEQHWECDVCGYRDPDCDTVFNHVLNVHNYPEEDAGLCTTPVFV
jgi:hypothetical protein